ncbi:MAG: NAD-dependent epimerase/dehydratase family protein [Chloroflexi bacterium]|nr:NAD-dependent epimerase/dehydratase family protein [Chloroflexota bacterium]
MRVLVFGGTRYFGRAAVEILLSQGHRVSVFTRGNVRPPFWDQIEHIQGDRTDIEGLVSKLKGRKFDAVIDNQCFTREEAEGAVRALRGNIGRYVVASTVSTYGEGGHALRRQTVSGPPASNEERFWVDYRLIDPVPEDASDVSKQPWEYRSTLSKYGEGKRHVERVMLESPRDWPFVAIRVPATLGPDDPTGRFAWWLWRIQDGDPVILPDGGKHAVQLGYSLDLARFIVDCLTAPKVPRQIYNFAQRETPRFVHVLEAIADSAGRPLNAVAIPSEILHRFSGLPWHEWSYAPFCDLNITMSLRKAEQDVGLPYTPLREWVKATTDWYLANPAALETTRWSELRWKEVLFAGKWKAARERLGWRFEGEPSP